MSDQQEMNFANKAGVDADVRSEPAIEVEAPRTDRVKWPHFAHGAAVLRRVEVGDGRMGLAFVYGKRPEGQAVRKAAMELGFDEIPGKNIVIKFRENGKFPFGIQSLSRHVGAEILDISRAEMVKNTVYIGMEAPKVEPEPEKKFTPIRSVRIGVNGQNHEVFQAENGRYMSKFGDLVVEKEGDNKADFLRASKREDLPAIAYAIFRDAKKTNSLSRSDIMHFIDFAMQKGPDQSAPEYGADEAFEIIRNDLLGQISEVALNDDSSRTAWNEAVALGNVLGNALSVDTPPGEKLRPSPLVMILMRRLSAGRHRVDAMVSPQMAAALPQATAQDADYSVLDMSEIPAENWATYLGNRMAARPHHGRSVLFFPVAADDVNFRSTREEIAKIYGIEAAIELPHALADGLSGTQKWVMVSVGDRRPEPLQEAPVAALRMHHAMNSDDVFSFERDVHRAHGKLKEFNAGEADLARQNVLGEIDDDKHVPYTAMSRQGEASTVIPFALQGAMMRAQTKVMRHFEDQGGVDGAVSAALGFSIEEMGKVYLPEQIDAMAFWAYSRDMGKGFALIDGTGVGKTHTIAGVIRIALRDMERLREERLAEIDAAMLEDPDMDPVEVPRAKCLYLTESILSLGDLLKTFKDCGIINKRIGILTAKAAAVITVNGAEVTYEAYSASERKAIFESGKFPDDVDIMISTYSMFNREGSPASKWAGTACDEFTIVVGDECHNAINLKGNTGKNIEKLKKSVKPWNFLAATATPYKTPEEAIFYEHLIPDYVSNKKELLRALPSGREAAQEGLTTQLTEDGSWLRRSRDLSGVVVNAILPDPETLEYNQRVQKDYSLIARRLVKENLRTVAKSNQITAQRQADLIAQGMDPNDARKIVNRMRMVNENFNSAVGQMNRTLFVAMRCRSALDHIIQQFNEGKKAIVSFDQTMMRLFDECQAAGLPLDRLTMRDQIMRVINRAFTFKLRGQEVKINGQKVRIQDEVIDLREIDPEIKAGYDALKAMVDEFEALPASPIDDLLDKIRASNYTMGELSGRPYTYSDGKLVKRSNEDRDKALTIHKFNNGGFDGAAHNKAGATSGNMQAKEGDLDLRQRSTNIVDPFEEIFKLLQAFGRTNRYMQTSSPIINWHMTGLMGETLMFQQLNRRLRKLGASVEASRDHPMLVADVPDYLNKVGDMAFIAVLQRNPEWATLLGVDLPPEETIDDEDLDSFDGNNFAGRCMSMMMALEDSETRSLMQQVALEFRALTEDLDARGENPLKPKMTPGEFHVVAEAEGMDGGGEFLYSGLKRDPDDPGVSSFTAPIMIRTGYVEYEVKNLTGANLLKMVKRANRLGMAEGYAEYAQSLRANIPGLLSRYVPTGVTIQHAMANPQNQSDKFRSRFEELNLMVSMLAKLKPGVTIRGDLDTMEPGVIKEYVLVDMTSPGHIMEMSVPSAYRMKLESAGTDHSLELSLGRLMAALKDADDIQPGLSQSDDPNILFRFDAMAGKKVKKSVQIMDGPLLSVIMEAKKRKLGSLSIYKDAATGLLMRGVVVFDGKKDLRLLPADIRHPQVARGLVATVTGLAEIGHIEEMKKKEQVSRIVFSGNMTDGENADKYDAAQPDFKITVTKGMVLFDLVPPRIGNHDFYAERVGLHEALFGADLPERDKVGSRRRGTSGKHAGIVRIKTDDPRNIDRIKTAIHLLFARREKQNANFYMTGEARDLINRIHNAVATEIVVAQEAEAKEAEAKQAAETAQKYVDEAKIFTRDIGDWVDWGYEEIEWGGDLFDQEVDDATVEHQAEIGAPQDAALGPDGHTVAPVAAPQQPAAAPQGMAAWAEENAVEGDPTFWTEDVQPDAWDYM